MSSVLKTLLDNLQSQITENATNIETNTTDITEALTRITTAEGDITELGDDLNTTNSNVSAVTSEVTTARGSYSNLNARFESVDDDLEAAQNDAAEALGTANSANSSITAAAGSFSSLADRLNDMDSDITNITADTNANTEDISLVSAEITRARRGYNSLYTTIGAASMCNIGLALTQAAKTYWVDLENGVKYYNAQGFLLESSENATYSIRKYNGFPVGLVISIANILTVTSEMLIQSTISPITVDGVLYSVYFIKMPEFYFNSQYSVMNSYLPSPFIASSDPSTITALDLGSVDSMNSTNFDAGASLYLPVLRPSTNPGTIFRFLRTTIDPDTNTVQYVTFNSNITVFL